MTGPILFLTAASLMTCSASIALAVWALIGVRRADYNVAVLQHDIEALRDALNRRRGGASDA